MSLLTPYNVKLSKCFEDVKNPLICKTLRDNVEKIEDYRLSCDYNFKRWFGDLDQVIWKRWLKHERDFVFSTHGLSILKTRYLFASEPIQYGMLRIALRLVGSKSYEFLRITYDLLSCGILAVSSILAASSYQKEKYNRNDNGDDTKDDDDDTMDFYSGINQPGEACRLFVLKDDYGINLTNQLSYITALLCLGVGVGLDASCIPSKGFTEPGKIRSGFGDLCRKFESCNTLSMYERKPKTTIYVNICYETCLEMFDFKIPAQSPLHNVFFGLFVPNLFMECVKNDEMWYLFSGELKDRNNKRLSDYYGDAFVLAYYEWVASGLYVREIKATELMRRILHCQELSGSPYIMWSDHINMFNNQAHMGTVTTSNLCAEIVNVSTPEESSSCSLICCNMAPFKDHRIVMNRVYKFINDIHGCGITNKIFNEFERACFSSPESLSSSSTVEFGECAKYAYAVGYMATLVMNCFMGKDRRRRELGVSPMGVQDMAFIIDKSPTTVCAVISEAMYRGSIQSSCHIAQNRIPIDCIDRNIIDVNYKNSGFSKGYPQWSLRNSSVMSNWHEVQYDMLNGMANTMLTAQAPTATTSLLLDNTESVLLAMDIFTLKENECGRSLSISYGIMTKYMKDDRDLTKIKLSPSVDEQIDMYRVSAPFIDQTQSVMLSIPLDASIIFKALLKTWKAKMKTGIYYFNFQQRLATFQTIRNNATDDANDDSKFETTTTTTMSVCDALSQPSSSSSSSASPTLSLPPSLMDNVNPETFICDRRIVNSCDGCSL